MVGLFPMVPYLYCNPHARHSLRDTLLFNLMLHVILFVTLHPKGAGTDLEVGLWGNVPTLKVYKKSL